MDVSDDAKFNGEFEVVLYTMVTKLLGKDYPPVTLKRLMNQSPTVQKSKELYEQDLSQVRKIPVEVCKGILSSKKNIA